MPAAGAGCPWAHPERPGAGERGRARSPPRLLPGISAPGTRGAGAFSWPALHRGTRRLLPGPFTPGVSASSPGAVCTDSPRSRGPSAAGTWCLLRAPSALGTRGSSAQRSRDPAPFPGTLRTGNLRTLHTGDPPHGRSRDSGIQGRGAFSRDPPHREPEEALQREPGDPPHRGSRDSGIRGKGAFSRDTPDSGNPGSVRRSAGSPLRSRSVPAGSPLLPRSVPASSPLGSRSIPDSIPAPFSVPSWLHPRSIPAPCRVPSWLHPHSIPFHPRSIPAPSRLHPIPSWSIPRSILSPSPVHPGPFPVHPLSIPVHSPLHPRSAPAPPLPLLGPCEAPPPEPRPVL